MVRLLIISFFFLLPASGTQGGELTELKLNRLFSELYLKEGEKRVEAGELPQGRFFLNESAAKDPMNARAYNLAGIAEVRLGNLKSAETYLTLATTADPDCSECRQNLGNVFLARGKYQLALLTFHRVLQDKSYPTPWLPLYGSGMAYMKRKDYDRAIQMFEQVLEYVPAGLDLEIKEKINRALYLKNQKGLAR